MANPAFGPRRLPEETVREYDARTIPTEFCKRFLIRKAMVAAFQLDNSRSSRRFPTFADQIAFTFTVNPNDPVVVRKYGPEYRRLIELLFSDVFLVESSPQTAAIQGARARVDQFRKFLDSQDYKPDIPARDLLAIARHEKEVDEFLKDNISSEAPSAISTKQEQKPKLRSKQKPKPMGPESLRLETIILPSGTKMVVFRRTQAST